ncbi:Pr6Pr family membrane protein [Spiroplasma sp. DGKH1]|uniref:Pr6Pr family membrane protein n=1 Tax=Spiroplasma sp. DGKH1 TaxID=3050074 RepID=UPI0034C5E410
MFYQKEIWKDWRVYYKLFFGGLIGAVCLYGWISPLVNGITIPSNVEWSNEASQNFMKDKGDFTFNYFSFFTIQTNILVWVWLLAAGLFPKYEGKNKWLGYNMALAITVYISITFLIYNAMLLPAGQPTNAKGWFLTVIQHMVCPIAMIVYFLFMMPKNEITPNRQYWNKQVWKLYFYPILWGIFNMIRGEFRWQAGKAYPYQYFFLNVHKPFAGLPGAAWFVIAIIIIAGLVFGLATLYNTICYKLGQRKLQK